MYKYRWKYMHKYRHKCKILGHWSEKFEFEKVKDLLMRHIQVRWPFFWPSRQEVLRKNSPWNKQWRNVFLSKYCQKHNGSCLCVWNILPFFTFVFLDTPPILYFASIVLTCLSCVVDDLFPVVAYSPMMLLMTIAFLCTHMMLFMQWWTHFWHEDTYTLHTHTQICTHRYHCIQSIPQ